MTIIKCNIVWLPDIHVQDKACQIETYGHCLWYDGHCLFYDRHPIFQQSKSPHCKKSLFWVFCPTCPILMLLEGDRPDLLSQLSVYDELGISKSISNFICIALLLEMSTVFACLKSDRRFGVSFGKHQQTLIRGP